MCVDLLSLGSIPGALLQPADDALPAQVVARGILLARFGRPGEVSTGIHSAPSDAASHVTTTEVFVDDGNDASSRQ